MTKRETVTVTLELELDHAEQTRLLQNSIERVMNNAIQVGQHAQDPGDNDDSKAQFSEQGSILWQDCQELKPLVNKIWWAVQEAVRKKI